MSVKSMRIGLEKALEDQKCLDELILRKVEAHMRQQLLGIWTRTPEEYVVTVQEAISQLTLDKSPGYPYFNDCQTKLEALYKYYDEIFDESNQLLAGVEVEQFFALTEKSELRTKEKVEQHKTRVFMASPLPHLIASIVLFGEQNDEMMRERIEAFPGTIGIQIPGPEFVRLMSSLGDAVNDGDVSGNDLRFNLRIARLIRDLRSSFLPDRYHDCIAYLYDTVYAGNCVGLGGVYQVNGNKSGCFTTAQDNTLQTWAMILYGFYSINPLGDPLVMRHFVNSDDIIGNYNGYFGGIIDECKKVNFIIETPSVAPRGVQESTFLSHHLERIYVKGFGDLVVCAGNLPKILASRDWIKKSTVLTFEEVCVAHLCGIRMCLFPWDIYFEEADFILSQYLSTIVITKEIRLLLRARLSRQELAILHTRMEGEVSFFLNSFLSKRFTPDDYRELLSYLYPADLIHVPDKKRNNDSLYQKNR